MPKSFYKYCYSYIKIIIIRNKSSSLLALKCNFYIFHIEKSRNLLIFFDKKKKYLN